MNEYTLKFIGLFVGVIIGGGFMLAIDMTTGETAATTLVNVGITLVALRVSGIVK